MKEKRLFIGIDVSKRSLDICILNESSWLNYKCNNSPRSIQTFFTKLIKKNSDLSIEVCMENTGYYNWHCFEVFEQLKLKLYVVNALHLKRSMGMVRGKNDVIDSYRIAKYISLHYLECKPSIIARKVIRELQALLAQRKRLVETRTKLSVPCNELKFMTNKKFAAKAKKSSQQVLKVLDLQIKEIEKDLDELILSDQELTVKFKYITSVQGVGKVLAWSLLIKTNEFKSINNPRKLACFAGVVPFDFSSGSSIYKKPRVSFMADKSLKKLLHLAAMRAIQLNGDLKTYYLRKVSEGKNKMLVLNAVRNKIVARVCSVINNEKNYQVNLHLS